MNTEILIGQAAEAIKMFNIDHEGTCYLTVKDGFVTGIPRAELTKVHPTALIVERYDLRRGFTPARWHAIGRELFILYTKEKQCQAHQRPSTSPSSTSC